jgi:hypothetical protein
MYEIENESERLPEVSRRDKTSQSLSQRVNTTRAVPDRLLLYDLTTLPGLASLGSQIK